MKTTLACILFILLTIESFSQCGCGVGASAGGLAPVAGSANVGVVRTGNFRIFAYYSHSQGSDYFKGDINQGKGPIESFSSDFSGINVAYGLTRKFTLEADFGYFFNKTQRIYETEHIARGPSYLSLSGKYNIFYDFENSVEITFGLGARLPMSDKAKSQPQHIRPSTGAYGVNLQAFFFKGFEQVGLSLIYFGRAELNTKNSETYRYGYSFVNSVFLVKPFFENFSGALELSDEHRMKDNFEGSKICDSGGNILVVSPQVSYSLGLITLTAAVDYPIYAFYNGSQLARDFNISFIINIELE